MASRVEPSALVRVRTVTSPRAAAAGFVVAAMANVASGPGSEPEEDALSRVSGAELPALVRARARHEPPPQPS